MNSGFEQIDAFINASCSDIINKLAFSLRCESPQMISLRQKNFTNGSVFVAMIKKFEEAFDERLATNYSNNYQLIDHWLAKYGIKLRAKQSVQQLLASNKLSYLALICYVFISVFLKFDKQIRRRIVGYNFAVDLKSLMQIVKFVKWKLCEEELEIIESQINIQKEQIRALRSENLALKITAEGLVNEINGNKNKFSKFTLN